MKHTVLVTGASGGIGEAIAKRFAEDGHRVVIHYNTHKAKAEAMLAGFTAAHLSAMIVQADVTDPVSVNAMLYAVGEKFGAVDVLVNNAGTALPQQLLTDCTLSDWDRSFHVNCRGMFLCTKAVLPGMIENKWGSIVNISSEWGITGGSCEAPYSAAKAAVIGFTKSLAKEVAPSGIRVNCVAPGFILTEMNAHLSMQDVENIRQNTPLEALGAPGDVAHAVHFLALETAQFITGQVLSVDGGAVI